MLALLRHLSGPEWRHHPWRPLAALLAVMLGVALAFSVQLINQSAQSEFSAAVRAVNGEPDVELRGQRGGFDEQLYERVARHPDIALASPVIEAETQMLTVDAQGLTRRLPLRVLGIDALVAGPLSPALMPRLSAADKVSPDAGSDRLGLFDTDAVSLNAAARQRLGAGETLRVQTAHGLVSLRVHGSVAAGGPPLAVMDIAGAQAHFGMLGRLSRIDVRLTP
ncbi:MAG: ABC transporter permease, partial [Burkholderiaceae bacterium]|nr:ABC transporter permease [Burkholderiaceae bacterium]